jgi:hypothetical protein
MGKSMASQLLTSTARSVRLQPPDEAYVTRKEMLRVRTLADRRILKSSLYRGQCILGYRESLGGDHRWHAQVVLADGSRVFLNEAY